MSAAPVGVAVIVTVVVAVAVVTAALVASVVVLDAEEVMLVGAASPIKSASCLDHNTYRLCDEMHA